MAGPPAPRHPIPFEDPANFHWGTGIEDTFVPQEDERGRRLDEYELVQHYRFWREDIDAAADIGFDMIRYGIPWYRVQPQPDRFDWRWLDEVIPYLVDRGLEPIVDLVHYGAPLWLEGGLLHPLYPEFVAAYAAAFAARYRDLVRLYTPVNEPSVQAVICGLNGRWPPYLRGEQGYVRTCNAICRGFVQTVRALRGEQPDCSIVHVEGSGFWVLSGDDAPADRGLTNERPFFATELVTGAVSPGTFLHDYATHNGMTDEDVDWFALNAIDLDVVGVNFYPDGSVHLQSTDEAGGVKLSPLWGGREFLCAAVRDWYERYRKPVLVSECSVNERSTIRHRLEERAAAAAVHDGSELRQWWLQECAEAVDTLRSEGIPIAGFVWWPLLDAAGWSYREGRGPVGDYLEPSGLLRLAPDDNGALLRERLAVADDMRGLIARERRAVNP